MCQSITTALQHPVRLQTDLLEVHVGLHGAAAHEFVVVADTLHDFGFIKRSQCLHN